MDTNGEASLNSALSALRAFLIAVGGFLAANGMGNSGLYKDIEMAASAILIIGPSVWGVYVAICHVIEVRNKQTQAVQAGINLAASGNMLTHEVTPGIIAPVPVTQSSAAEIIKDFAPK